MDAGAASCVRLQLETGRRRLSTRPGDVDPNAWSGSASQEGFVELAVSGLASMYPAFGWNSLCSGPAWKSACLRSHWQTDLSGPKGSPVLAGAEHPKLCPTAPKNWSHRADPSVAAPINPCAICLPATAVS